jgi:integrase
MRPRAFFRIRPLSCQYDGKALRCHARTSTHPLFLHSFRRGHENHGIDPAVAARLEQQGNIENDESCAPFFRLGQESIAAGGDQRMHDRLEPCQRRRIVEDPGAKEATIDHAIAGGPRKGRLDHRRGFPTIERVDHGVGVMDRDSLGAKHRGGGRFPHADRPREAQNKHHTKRLSRDFFSVPSVSHALEFPCVPCLYSFLTFPLISFSVALFWLFLKTPGLPSPASEKSRQRTALTVSSLIDAYLDDHGDKLKPRTRDGYEALLGKVRAAHGCVKAAALNRSQVAVLHRSLSATPYAANRMLAAVSSLYGWAVDHELLPEGHGNPAARLTRFKERSRERFLTPEELARLGDALAGDLDIDPFAIAAIWLLILTGARLREILHTKWGEVDFERGIIFLPDSKTGKKPVFLNAAALAVLADIPRLEGNPHVFPGRKDGQPRDGLDRPWSAIRKAAGLDGLRIHDLRHSFASIGAGGGLGLPIIGKLLGHTQAATTQRYAHLANVPVRQAVETIGATISAAMSRKPGAVVVPIKRAK